MEISHVILYDEVANHIKSMKKTILLILDGSKYTEDQNLTYFDFGRKIRSKMKFSTSRNWLIIIFAP